MSRIICSNCGTISQAEYKFCVACGSDLRGGTKTDFQAPQIKQDTFFCPNCNQENFVDNYNCSDCGEDFSKYRIRASFSETTKSRTGVVKDVIKAELPGSTRNWTIMIVITVVVLIGGGIFMWWLMKALSGSW